MTSTPPLYRGDIAPLKFAVAVLLGGLGSAMLSYARVPAWVSVVFALAVMVILALFRIGTAIKFKDFQSLETFAEDIYLLGYLLTLAALLGLSPRLMSDETNLFHIAGLKLVTTVVGLGMMMVFRQIARRWADEKEREPLEKFIEQQKLFSEAIGRVNKGADELTAKLDEVISHFDPALLVPVAEWSNRAADAFSAATSTFEKVPLSIEEGIRGVRELGKDLAETKAAAATLAGVLSAGTAEAAKALAAEFGQTTTAAGKVAISLTSLEPTSRGAADALQTLGKQANAGGNKFGESAASLQSAASELTRTQAALKKLVDLHEKDTEAPLAVLSQLVKRLSEVRSEIGETNRQIQLLVERVETAMESRPRLFSWFAGPK